VAFHEGVRTPVEVSDEVVDTLVVDFDEEAGTLVVVSLEGVETVVVAADMEGGTVVDGRMGVYKMAVVFQLEEVHRWVVSLLGEVHKWVC